jgi:ribosomal protein L37AE/L43A
MKNKPKTPECPVCELHQTLTRKDGIRWCRSCGAEWLKDSKEDSKEDGKNSRRKQ